MLGSELGEERTGGASLTAPGFFQALADSFSCVCARGDVEETLVGLGILNNGGCLPLNREHYRALRFMELL